MQAMQLSFNSREVSVENVERTHVSRTLTRSDNRSTSSRSMTVTETLQNQPPSGFTITRSIQFLPPQGFIFLFFNVVFTFFNKMYQITAFYIGAHDVFASIVLFFTLLNLFSQYVFWVNYGGGSPLSEVRRCCRRGTGTRSYLIVFAVERMTGSPLTGYVTIYAFLYIGEMTYLSVASALYGLVMYTKLSSSNVACSNFVCKRGELAVYHEEDRWMFKLYSYFLAILTATELVLACSLALVLHPLAVFFWLAAQSAARFVESKDPHQVFVCLVTPITYFAFAAPFAKQENSVGLSLFVQILRLIVGSTLFFFIDLPHGFARVLPSVVLSAVPQLGRPMGQQVAEEKFVEPMMTKLNMSMACIGSAFQACDAFTDVREPVIEEYATLKLGTPLFRAMLLAIICVGVPVSIVVLTGLLLFNSKLRTGRSTPDDELKLERMLKKEEEIEQWCERREKRLAGLGIRDMVARDIWRIADFDTSEGFGDIGAELDEGEEDLAPRCQTCNGQGFYGCRANSACNECNGTGLKGHKRCKIEDTSNAQGSIPCPGGGHQTCKYCGREFCAYHHFVNNSDAAGSFGGHQCINAPPEASRQKNAFHAVGAMAGHMLGFW